ncbi:YlxR family protein [Actinomyces sp. F1_1611]
MSHTPTRTCVGCGEKAPQSELLRLVRQDGQIILDPVRRLGGRGAWVHPRAACVRLGLTPGRVARSFRQSNLRTEAALAAALELVTPGEPGHGVQHGRVRATDEERKRVGS